MAELTVAGLTIYPVKGLRGIDVSEAMVERQGLRHDRRWAILGPDDVVLTQRDLPEMARIDALPDGEGLRLQRSGFGGVEARAEPGDIAATVWRRPVPVTATNPGSSEWLSRVLGTTCRLVYQADPGARPVKGGYGGEEDCVSLADGFPLLVTNEASLGALNATLEQPVPMRRFRPNLVVAGARPWAEDQWARVTLPNVRLRLPNACARCRVITIDQGTGDVPVRMEPLRTLGQMRRDEDGAITFGWNAIPEVLGTVRVGETVVVEERL